MRLQSQAAEFEARQFTSCREQLEARLADITCRLEREQQVRSTDNQVGYLPCTDRYLLHPWPGAEVNGVPQHRQPGGLPTVYRSIPTAPVLPAARRGGEWCNVMTVGNSCL